MASRRLKQLQKRLIELEGHFLPTIKLSGNYSKKELDNTRAYCVLAHAEIESYFEDMALMKVDKSVNKWVAAGRKKPSQIIFYLVSNCSKAPATKSNPPIALVHISLAHYKASLLRNHGVKSDNLDDLFGYIGFTVDTTLAATLNSFGQQRGEIAHKSIYTLSPIDPSTEKSRITLIVTGLVTFEIDFLKYS